jgi:hypothetical protein
VQLAGPAIRPMKSVPTKSWTPRTQPLDNARPATPKSLVYPSENRQCALPSAGLFMGATDLGMHADECSMEGGGALQETARLSPSILSS